jgi:hypothetical protein
LSGGSGGGAGRSARTSERSEHFGDGGRTREHSSDGEAAARTGRTLRRTEKTANVAVVVYDADAAKSSALAKLGVTSVVTRDKSDGVAQAVVDRLDGTWVRSGALTKRS